MGKCYSLCNGFVHRKIADVDVIICIGDRVADFNGYLNLNETASFLWDALVQPKSVDQLADALVGEFDVTREQALADVQTFVQQLVEQNMLREVAHAEP